MNVAIQLPYGKEKVFVEFPRDRLAFVVKPKDFQGVEDEEEEIRRALRNPVDAPRISESASEDRMWLLQPMISLE